MNDKAQQQGAGWAKTQAIAAIVGIVAGVAVGLLTERGALWGAVMGVAFGTGLQASPKICQALSGRMSADAQRRVKYVAFIITIVVVAIILGIVNTAVDLAPVEGDDVITSIIKHIFEYSASLALALGVLLSAVLHERQTE